MASEYVNLIPDGVDDSGNNWSTNSGGADLVAELNNTNNSTHYLYAGTNGLNNTFTFDDIDPDDYLDVQWIKYIVTFGTSVASERARFTVKIIDGADDSVLYNTLHRVVGPSHTGKVETEETGIIPYVGGGGALPPGIGGTVFTETQVNNIKIYIEATVVGPGGNLLEIMDLQVYAMMNVTDPDPPGTYVNISPNIESKNGLIELKNGLTIIK
jgi:hypothetical protein